MEMIDTLASFIINWFPSLLFLIIISIATIVGLIRGFRKSVILAIQAAAALFVCLFAYLIVVNAPGTDRNIVSFVNMFAGDGFVQGLFDASTECTSLKEILIEFIPKNLNYGDGLSLIVKENGAYLGALVNLGYHIIFAIIFTIVYYWLVLVLYIVYFFAYPERRYKRKIKAKNSLLESEKPYNRRTLYGGLIGAGRGLVSGLVCLSFIGSLFFILAGGVGQAEEENYDYGDENYNLIDSIYQNVGNYGSSGIFKILNAIKDKDDVPYYLFAAEIVLQGGDIDSTTNESVKLYLPRELSAYVGFTRSTYNLLLKYDTDGVIKSIILNEAEELNIMDEMVKIIAKEEFQEEFGAIIDDFNGNTYFINLGLSLLDSITNHIDELELGLGEDVTEILAILFKKGYKSSYIPEDNYVVTPAHINASSLLSADDTKNLLKSVLSVLSIEAEGDDTQKLLTYAENILPKLTSLSIFSDERKDEMNPLLQRVYTYVINRYLPKDNPEAVELTSYTKLLSSQESANIDWIKEINGLLDLALNAIDLVNIVYTGNEDKEILDIVFDAFDKTNDMYDECQEAYKNIKNDICNSSLLSLVFSDSGLYRKLENAILSFAPEAYMFDDIYYVNKLDSNGNVVEYGEVYNLLTAVETVLNNEKTKSVLQGFLSDDFDPSNISALLLSVKDAVAIFNTPDGNGETVFDYVLKSKVAQSVISGLIIANKTIDEENNIVLYITDANLQEVDGNTVNVLKPEEISLVLNNASSLIDTIIPYLDEADADNFNKITPLISRLTQKNNNNQSIVDNLLESSIIEGTLVNVISNVLNQESLSQFISMPDNYMIDGKANVNEWIKNQEIKNIVNGIAVSGLDFDVFLSENEDSANQLLDQIKEIGKKENSEDESLKPVTTLLKSKLLHYTLSGILINDSEDSILPIKVVVPADAKAKDENNNVIDNLVNVTEITDVIKLLPELLDAVMPYLDENDEGYNKITPLIDRLTVVKENEEQNICDKLLNSLIIEYTLSNTIADILKDDSLSDYVTIPSEYLNEDGTNNLDAWHSNKEISNLINGIAASGLDFDSFMNSSSEDVMLDQIKVLGNKDLDTLENKVLASKLLHYTISNLLIDKDYSGITILVPYSSMAVENEDINDKLVSKSEIAKTIKQIPTLLDGDLSDVNSILKTVVNNSDELLSLPILLTTIVLYLNENFLNTLDSDLFVIPLAYKDNAAFDVLKNYDPNATENMNLWHDEAPALVKGIDVLLGITEGQSVDFNDMDAVSNTVKGNIKNLNQMYADTNELKIDVTYRSDIIVASLAKSIDKAFIENDGIANSNAVASLREESYYANETEEERLYTYPRDEFYNLINAVNELNLDLSQDINVTKVAEDIEKYNLPASLDNSKTTLQLIYESDIIKYVIYEQLNTSINKLASKENMEAISDEIYESINGYDYYKISELATLVDAVNALDVDLNYQNISTVKLNDNVKNAIIASTIMKLVITEKLDGITDIIVPASAKANSKPYLANTELDKLFTILINNKNDLFDNSGENVDITTINVDNITLSLMNQLITSTILHATMINQLANKSIDGIVIPDNYKEASSASALDDFDNNIWVKENEISNLISAIEMTNLIAGDEKLDSVDSGSIKTLVKNLNTNMVTAIYNSLIFKCSLSNTVEGTVTVPVDAYLADGYLLDGNEYKIITKDEIVSLVTAVNRLELDFDNISLQTIKLDSKDAKYISASKIIRYKLHEKLNDVDAIIVPNSALNSYDYLSEEEATKLLTILADNKDSFFNTTDNNIDLESLNIDTNNLSINVLRSTLSSIIFHATMIKNINELNINGVVIPQEYKDSAEENELIEAFDTNTWVVNNEIDSLLSALALFTDNELISSLSIDDITAKVATLNDKHTNDSTKLDVCYKSVIMQATMTSKMDEALTVDLIDQNIKLYELVKNTYYTKTEIANLIEALKELEIADLNNIDSEYAANKMLNPNTSVDKLHSSYILWGIVSKQLDIALTDNNVHTDVINDSKLELGTTGATVYTALEVKKLINSINEVVDTQSGTGLDELLLVTSTTLLNKDIDFNVIYSSNIMVDVISQKISQMFEENKDIYGNSTLRDHDKAKYNYNSSILFYKQLEVESLIGFMKHCNIGTSEDFSADSIVVTREVIDSFVVAENNTANSYILVATITANLLAKSEFLLPQSCYNAEDGIIKLNEIRALLLAMCEGVPGMKYSTFDPMTVTPASIENIDILTASIIMKANITSCIYNDSPDCEGEFISGVVSVDRNLSISASYEENNNAFIYILTADEIKNIINAFKILNPDSFTLDISYQNLISVCEIENGNLVVDNIYTVLKSSLMHFIISDFISAYRYSYAGTTYKYDDVLAPVASINIYTKANVITYNLVYLGILQGTALYKFNSATEIKAYNLEVVESSEFIVDEIGNIIAPRFNRTRLSADDICAYLTYLYSSL